LKTLAVVVSCEHAGNSIPKAYKEYFADAQEELQSHRGWDPGSKLIGELLSAHLKAPLFMTETSRLLVECNRSLGQPQLFSEFSAGLSTDQKQSILNQYYHPHRNKVKDHITQLIELSTVLHLSIHTFTPIWEGVERKTDIGLLFDDERKTERGFCEKWKQNLQKELPGYQIDFNKPYLGSDDGFTTFLRTQFKQEDYLGIEIEVNQKFSTGKEIRIISDALSKSLAELI
jgi:predicted N-formylglutamate amidohydrolase